MNKVATREEFEKLDVFGIGAPNVNFAQYFIGESFLKPVTDPAEETKTSNRLAKG